METFTEVRGFTDDPEFGNQRKKILAGLDGIEIDKPIIGLIKALNVLPYCFTLQCCYGHFLFPGREAPYNCEPLPAERIGGSIDYKIAYLAFCLENSARGRGLLEELRGLTAIDPENIQFGCADWFWNQRVNTFVLQVEPDRFKYEDRVLLEYEEALRVQKARDEFYARLEGVLIKA